MGKIIKSAITLCLVLGMMSSFGAVKKKERTRGGVSLKQLSSLNYQVKGHNKKIRSLKKSLIGFESALGKENSKYLKVITGRKEIEKEIYDLKNKIAVHTDRLQDKFQDSNDALNGVVLGSLEEEQDTATLLSNKIMVNVLKKRLFALKMAMSENEVNKNKLTQLENSFHQHIALENEFSRVLKDLEGRKRNVAISYDKTLKRKEGIKLQYDRLKAKSYRQKHKKLMAQAKDIGIKFAAPISNFSGIGYKKKKGVSFYFRKMQPVTAPAKGKIVFKGSVGSFGKIVFIDHGNDIRSVILGNYLPKVTKGMFVKKGDILGYTDQIGNKVGEVYYELREKNKAMNTITLLDKDSLVVKK
ncbi:MAG: peptidoglycan DD-metalloendopeptidase family protein [Bacteriovoracaceae bacterium]|nr:peptidoglycan DD-metalloendopeptidase family protein [Bacteriovoracaceae bacterium]